MSKASTRTERQRRRRLIQRVAELEQHLAAETRRADDLEVLIREGRFKVGVRIAKLTKETRRIPKPSVESKDGAIRLRLADGEAASTIDDLVKCFKAFSNSRKLRTDPARAAATTKAVDEWIYNVARRIHAEQDPNIFNDAFKGLDKFLKWSVKDFIASRGIALFLNFALQFPARRWVKDFLRTAAVPAY